MQGYTKTDIVINKLAGNLYLRTLCYIDYYSLLVNDFELRCNRNCGSNRKDFEVSATTPHATSCRILKICGITRAAATI